MGLCHQFNWSCKKELHSQPGPWLKTTSPSSYITCGSKIVRVSCLFSLCSNCPFSPKNLWDYMRRKVTQDMEAILWFVVNGWRIEKKKQQQQEKQRFEGFMYQKSNDEATCYRNAHSNHSRVSRICRLSRCGQLRGLLTPRMWCSRSNTPANCLLSKHQDANGLNSHVSSSVHLMCRQTVFYSHQTAVPLRSHWRAECRRRSRDGHRMPASQRWWTRPWGLFADATPGCLFATPPTGDLKNSLKWQLGKCWVQVFTHADKREPSPACNDRNGILEEQETLLVTLEFFGDK